MFLAMNDFDKIFKQKLENYTETPPPEVFGKIKDNYPKRSIGEFVSAYKFYIMAAVAVVGIVAAVVAVSLPQNDVENEIAQTDNTTPDVSESNISDSGEALYTNPDELKQEQTPQTKSSELIVQSNKIDLLNLNDTIICGDELSVDGLNINNASISNGLKLVKTSSGVKVCSPEYKSGILFVTDGKHVVDSARITFVKPEEVFATASKTYLCYGEKMQINMSGSASEISWNDDNYSVSKLGTNNYEISELNPGSHNIVLKVGQHSCMSLVEFNVQVAEKPNYSISSEANYCSQNNGKVVVAANNMQMNYCKLNSSISRSGIFTGLGSGTYPIEINYAKSCVAYDTVKIADNGGLKVSFESRPSAFNDMTYDFRNSTRLVDSDNTQDVEFEWLVNGVAKSSDYNFEYEFPNSGNYRIELICRSGECESRKSEVVTITATNFKIPNIFTPNGDGIGDEFEVMYNGNLRKYEISIYTKGGQLVYQSTSIENSWNGKINGNNEAGEGVYFYVVTATDESGENITQKGTVNLKRQ